VLASLVVLMFAIILWEPVWLFHWHDYRVGNDIINRVEHLEQLVDVCPIH